VIETVKDMGTVVQTYNNIDLMRRQIELQDLVFAAVNENRDRKEQVHTPQEKLTVPAQLTFRKNAYWFGTAMRAVRSVRCAGTLITNSSAFTLNKAITLSASSVTTWPLTPISRHRSLSYGDGQISSVVPDTERRVLRAVGCYRSDYSGIMSRSRTACQTPAASRVTGRMAMLSGAAL
jgi:hypothetical protein